GVVAELLARCREDAAGGDDLTVEGVGLGRQGRPLAAGGGGSAVDRRAVAGRAGDVGLDGGEIAEACARRLLAPHGDREVDERAVVARLGGEQLLVERGEIVARARLELVGEEAEALAR